MNRPAVAMAFLFLLPALPVAAAENPTEVSVSGVGSVTQPPDLATVQATIETNAPGITDAVSENSARYENVVTALTRAGIARADVTLSSYNVDYVPKPKPAPVNADQRYGYTVTRSFTVKVRHIAMAGKVIDASTAAGATAVNDVGFAIADPADARNRAIALAVANAREIAQKAASAAGLRIVAIKSMDLGSGPIAPQGMAMARMAASAPLPTQLDQSNVTVTATVNVVFLAAP